jgi:hypothetical protein
MISVYKIKENNRFYIFISRGEDGFRFNLTQEELEDLYDKISDELKKTEKEKTEVVWNPRSHRHEIIKK